MAITTANITKVIKVTDTEILVISGTQDLTGYAKTADLGTAAFRDVGLSLTNVLTVDDAGLFSLSTTDSLFTSTVFTWDGTNNSYDSGEGDLLVPEGGTWLLTSTAGEIYRSVAGVVSVTNPSANTQWVTGTDHPDGEGLPADLTFVRDDYAVARVGDFDGYALTSQVGDRYLTSSTTSLLIGNGAKTLTVGTGLAYSPTQDVTIAFDVSNHMHASVTSYNSTTGVLVVDVQQHTGSGTHTAWTVNVGGIALGTLPTDGAAGTVLTKATSANYDTVWSTPSVAVGGITGLGTGVATALAVNVGSSGAPVVFNGVGGTPSSITLTNATGYPAATTTTAGITAVGIASPQSPVSTNAARISQVTAFGRLFNSVLFTDFLGGGYSGSPGTASDGYVFGTGVSGTGSAIAKLNAHVSGHAGILLLTTGTTTTGYSAYDTFNSSNTFRYDDGETVFEAAVRLPVLSTVTDEYSFAIGGSPQNNGVLGNDGAMFYYKRVSYGANWQAVTRNTASQTTTDTAVAVAANTWVRLTLIVNAAGTSVTYYINGTLVATITTNIPAGGAGREGCLLLKSAGTTSVTANVDYHFVGKTFTTSR